MDTGIAEIRPDPDRSGGHLVLLGGLPQSYVDLDDPRHLEFPYVRLLAAAVDMFAPPRVPLAVLHLGGGGLTLPRYIAVTRPGSPQRVVEWDAGLIEMVREHLPLPRGAQVRVRADDARTAVASMAPGRYDLVVTDVYAAGSMPGRLAGVEFATEVARLLRVNGWYAVNVADAPPLTFTRAHVAALRAVFDDVALVGRRAVLRGRRPGNIIALAGAVGDAAYALAAAGREPEPRCVLRAADLVRFLGGARPMTDATAADSPVPTDR